MQFVGKKRFFLMIDLVAINIFKSGQKVGF